MEIVRKNEIWRIRKIFGVLGDYFEIVSQNWLKTELIDRKVGKMMLFYSTRIAIL